MYIGNLHLHRNLYLRICNCAHGQYSKYIYVVICIVTFEHDTSSRAEIFAFRFPNGWPLVPLSCGCPHMRVGCDIQCGGCCCIMHVRDMVLAAREFAFNYVQVMWIDCVCMCRPHSRRGRTCAHGRTMCDAIGSSTFALSAPPIPAPSCWLPAGPYGQPLAHSSCGSLHRYDIWSGLRGLAVSLRLTIAVAVECQCGGCCCARSGNCYTGGCGTCVCPAACEINALLLGKL